MGTLVNIVCFGALALALLFAAGVVVFFVVAAIKKSRQAPPPPQAFARPVAPEPAPARYQERNFGDMALDWQEQVKREKERAAAKANLEVLFGVAEIVAKSPGVAAPKAE